MAVRHCVSRACEYGPCSKGCPLDFHSREFPLDRCAQTAIAKIPVILDHTEHDVFDLYCPRSFAGSFWHWLTEAAAEYTCDIAEGPAA